MEENTQRFWCIMLYYFKKGKNTTKMPKVKKICIMYGEGSVIDQMCQMWFKKFLGTTDIWPNNSLPRGCLMHWKIFSSTPNSQHIQNNIQINKN